MSFAFADDIQILFKGEYVFMDVLQSSIDFNINMLVTWLSCNGLSINTQKSKVMFFGNLQEDSIKVSIYRTSISVVSSMKCLGLFLDSGLVFDVHVNSLVSKVNFILKKLTFLDLVLPKKI